MHLRDGFGLYPGWTQLKTWDKWQHLAVWHENLDLTRAIMALEASAYLPAFEH